MRRAGGAGADPAFRLVTSRQAAHAAPSLYISHMVMKAESKLRFSAKARALRPMSRSRARSAQGSAMARARAEASRPGTTTPVSPASIFSMGPPLSLTMTGNPEAWASSTTLPKVSVVEGKTKRSAEA